MEGNTSQIWTELRFGAEERLEGSNEGLRSCFGARAEFDRPIFCVPGRTYADAGPIRIRETLLLRLFGRGQAFADALVDFDKLPVDAWERRVITRLLNDVDFDGKDAETNQKAQVTHAEQVRLLVEYVNRGILRGAARKAEKKAERAMLLRQLQLRFGALSSSVKRRVLAASEVRLHRWSERVLFAPTLEQVFASPRAGLSPKTAIARG